MNLLNKNHFLLALFFLTFSGLIAQDITFIIPDSLKNTSYNDLIDRYQKNYRDTLIATTYLNTYYKKAVLESDDLNQAIALGHIFNYLEGHEKKVEVLNLAMRSAKKADSEGFLLVILTLTGGYYHSLSNYDISLDYYFKALQLAEKINSEYYIYINKHNIALIKGDIGNYQESLNLFRECYRREVRIGDDSYLYDYLSSGLQLSEAFIRLNELDSAKFYLDQISSKVTEEYPSVSKKIEVYKNITIKEKEIRDYDKLVSSIQKLSLKQESEERSLIIGNYHAGMFGTELNLKNSYNHFKTVDSLHIKNGIYIPEVRFSFENLIRYYKSNKKLEPQLQYVDKLLKFDSIYNKQRVALRSKIYKRYDTPLLLREKESLIENLNKRNNALSLGTFILVAILFLFLVLAFRLYSRNKRLKVRFENTIKNAQDVSSNSHKEIPRAIKEDKNLRISKKIIDEVLDNLKDFEEEKQFLNKNLTSAMLAKKMGTNSKYLSQIINHYKDKNLTKYINDLRVDYSIEQLRSNGKFRKYTIQSIAEEVGFNNAESFSNAFFKKTGLKPSYFIKKLKDS